MEKGSCALDVKARRDHRRLAEDFRQKGCRAGRLFEEKGAGSILFTNIDVEGQQKGIDISPTRELVRAVGIPV